TKSGLVRLENVAKIGEAKGPAQIDRFARQRKITIIANLPDQAVKATSQAQGDFNRIFDEIRNDPRNGVTPEYQLIASGRAKSQNESNASFILAFGSSLVFMYMILAAQFESFVHPITILLSVPVTIPFALLSLIMLQQALTLHATLGVFLLFGIVKKNGILQVDYSNVLRARAREKPDEVPSDFRDPPARTSWWRWVGRMSRERRERLWAIMEANRTRLRPILMTTLMLIAGMTPIALGQGPGSGARVSMAKVIVGGQALSLLLSLLITPVGYSLFDDLGLLWRRLVGEAARPAQPAVEAKAETA
ncbi:MAG: efflux RND transporter permease subunit, partial [Tepidisphaerales bacterium]